MRKIIAGLFVSLDGVVQSPEQWHFPYFNDEMGEVVAKQQQECDAMLLGRGTYEEFAAFWPGQKDDAFADSMNSARKYVVSTTLKSADWENSSVISVADLAELKRQPGKHLGITGSPTLVRSLLAEGLLDELRLLIHPIVVGEGKQKLFDGSAQIPLRLIGATTFSTGVIFATYGKA